MVSSGACDWGKKTKDGLHPTFFFTAAVALGFSPRGHDRSWKIRSPAPSPRLRPSLTHSPVLDVNLTLQNAQTGTFTRSVVLFFSRFFALVFASGPHGFQERLAASQEAMKNKNVVNLGAIRQGMKRFQFLLNCCEPGTIPDASILAAALDLVWFGGFWGGGGGDFSLRPRQVPHHLSGDLPGGAGRRPGLPLPGVRPLRPPLQPRQLAGVDEGPPRQHHQEGPVQGPIPHRGQQKEPEAPVARRQAFLPVGRRELQIIYRFYNF